MSTRIICSFVLALLAPSVVLAAPSPSIDDALLEKAPAILEHARKRGFQNIGVLKFLVGKGENAPRDNVGDINMTLANKTEIALTLALESKKFGIINQASEFVVREKMTTANHLTLDGRKAFFARKYDLAWSGDPVQPSGFLTGTALFSVDLQQLTIKFQIFDKTGELEELPFEVVAATDPETIAQAGYSYARNQKQQSALIAGEPPPSPEVLRSETVDAAKSAAADTRSEGPFSPLVDSPVKLKILYNEKPIAITGDHVAEPGSNDCVQFVLSNPGPGTYAVVLLVNGENTLYQERSAPAVCRKWVLTPGSEVTISGFQVDKDTNVPFKVLRPDEVAPSTVSYGPHAGTYRMVVYHGTTSGTGPGNDTSVKADDKEAARLAMARARGTTVPVGVKPQSLRSLQAELRGRIGPADGARGYVVKGGKTERFETKAVNFVASSEIPVADITLRYTTPKQ